MPLDHFVSQVHLRKFISPALGNRMYAINKRTLNEFTPTPGAVCTVDDGSTNAYLRDDRAIEEFLRTIEPSYNNACDRIASGAPDHEAVYAAAGFVSYVLSCSPGGIRIQTGPMLGTLSETAMLMDAMGKFGKPPPELGVSSFTEFLEKGGAKFSIDPKYPQALGIASIFSRTSVFGNSSWDILVNPFDDNAFFTSDFPVAIEQAEDPRIFNRIAVLAPNLAIRIKPNMALSGQAPDFSFAGFKCRKIMLGRGDVMDINRNLVRCAEQMVFFRDDHYWTRAFVKKNARFRIEPTRKRLSHGSGSLLIFSQEVREVAP